MKAEELIALAKECEACVETFSGGDFCHVTFNNESSFEQFAQRIEQPLQQRIAELEKDCEILQANLDVAPMQVKQLREALEKIADFDGNWGPFPETNKQWCAMTIVTAREALEGTK